MVDPETKHRYSYTLNGVVVHNHCQKGRPHKVIHSSLLSLRYETPPGKSLKTRCEIEHFSSAIACFDPPRESVEKKCILQLLFNLAVSVRSGLATGLPYKP